MEKVEAAVYPDAVIKDGLVFLRVDWPLAWFRDCFVHDSERQKVVFYEIVVEVM